MCGEWAVGLGWGWGVAVLGGCKCVRVGVGLGVCVCVFLMFHNYHASPWLSSPDYWWFVSYLCLYIIYDYSLTLTGS